MKLNHTGHSKAILAAAVALVALLVVPSLAHALKLPITGGASWIVSGGTTVPIWPLQTVAGSVTVVTYIGEGGNPARLTVPTGVIGMPYTYEVSTPIPTPPYIAVTTNINMYGPISSPAVFKAGPKTTRPAAFNFCPGAAANPTCLTPNQGTKPGIVKYTPGVNQFGGTMKIFAAGTGEYNVYLGYQQPTIVHYPLTQPSPGPGVLGQTYGYKAYGTTYDASVTYGAVMANRRIIHPGTWVGSIEGNTFTYTGFPFTTGQVAVQVLHAPPTYPNSTFTTTGSDTRTLAGKGNITMVAGGLSHSSYPETLMQRQIFTLTVVPEPVLLLQLASGLLGLALLDKRRRRANR
jgi:hypothetical protein